MGNIFSGREGGIAATNFVVSELLSEAGITQCAHAQCKTHRMHQPGIELGSQSWACALALVGHITALRADKMTPAGLEPAIPGSVGRCLIHWATVPVDIPSSLAVCHRMPVTPFRAAFAYCLRLAASNVHQPGIEPGSHRWQQCILPLDH